MIYLTNINNPNKLLNLDYTMLISVFGNQARLQSFQSFSRLCHTDALIGAGLQEVLRQRHRVPDVRRLRIRPDQPTRRKRTSRQNRLRHRQVSYLGGRARMTSRNLE